MNQPDPWLPHRLHAQNRMRRGEARLFDAVITTMTVWLDTARALVLGKQLPAEAAQLLTDSRPAVTAAGTPDFDAARAATQVWARSLAEHVDPVLNEAFGEAFLDAARRADISPLPFQLEYLANVHDRLKIWPEGAFEELRPELLEMLSEGMDLEQIEERIGRILDIDAPARRIRAEISAIDRQLEDPDLTGVQRAELRARRRALWQQHDERNSQWQWLARRIARTEIHGAIEGGTLAAAQAVEAAEGGAHHKRWLATSDERTRGTHVVADGQIVKLSEPFRVGRAELQHPGEAGGPAHEVINCRCSTLILNDDEVRDALEGPWGGLGVTPGGARIGPDDPDDVAAALTRWQAEQRGEIVDDGDTRPPDATPRPEDQADDSAAGGPQPDEETEQAPEPILGRETREMIEQARATMPDDAAGWEDLTGREIRPAETYGERMVWSAEQDLERVREELEVIREDSRFADFQSATQEDLWWETDRRRRRVEEIDGKLSRARSANSIEKWTRELQAAQEDHDAFDKYMNLLLREELKQREISDLRDNPPKAKYWNEQVPALRESTYVEDGQGNLLPSAELDARLDTALEVGHAVWGEIQRAFDNDEGLRQLRKKLDDAEDTPFADVPEARRRVARAEVDIIRSALEEVREFGGHEQRAATAIPARDKLLPGDKRTLEDLRAVEPLFPREWLEAADGRGELALNRTPRAFFSAAGGGGGRDLIAAPLRLGEDYEGAFGTEAREVMAHELGHRMEKAVAGLTYLEYALVRRRATENGQLEKRSEIYPGSGEYALTDEWLRAYAGKVYDWVGKNPGRAAHEVFQVGLQDVFGRSLWRYGDDELHAFVLAMMVLL